MAKLLLEALHRTVEHVATSDEEGLEEEFAFAIKSVQDNSLQQVSQGKVVILGQAFQHFQEPLFDADSGLDAFDCESILWHEPTLLTTNVPGYICTRVGQPWSNRKR